MARSGRIARRAGANAGRAVRRLLARAAIPRAGGAWIVVRIGPQLADLAPPRLPWVREEASLSLLDVLEVLECAGSDPRVDGVLLRLTGSPSGWSKLLSLRRAVAALRERGVPVVAFADAYDAESLLLASAASRIWLPESGSVWLVGLRLESFFLRGLLDRVGARPEVVSVGRFKSAGEHFLRQSMSPEEREQLEALVDDLYGELVEGIASGRGLAPEAVRERVDRGPYSARAAVDAGLVDGCLYADEIEDALAELAPAPDEPAPRRVQLVEGAAYHALHASDRGWRPLFRGLPRLAYVVASGGIHRGSGARGIASDAFRRLLERLRREEEVRGVVLRLDSPGGDGTASDLLWRSVSQLTREKPVVVSMGDVVASGGYYIAAAADAVLAEAGTLTGSIGVVGGKLNLEGLYERVGVTKEAIERGARAGMLAESRGFTPDEKAAVRREMASVYDLFVDRVARGRRLEPAAVERVAQGRVWSGARALSLGLVDALGGPLEALRDARRHAGLSRDEPVLIDVHPRFSAASGLLPLLRWPPGRTIL